MYFPSFVCIYCKLPCLMDFGILLSIWQLPGSRRTKPRALVPEKGRQAEKLCSSIWSLLMSAVFCKRVPVEEVRPRAVFDVALKLGLPGPYILSGAQHASQVLGNDPSPPQLYVGTCPSLTKST